MEERRRDEKGRRGKEGEGKGLTGERKGRGIKGTEQHHSSKKIRIGSFSFYPFYFSIIIGHMNI